MQTIHNKFHTTRPVVEEATAKNTNNNKDVAKRKQGNDGSSNSGGGRGNSSDGDKEPKETTSKESDILLEISVRTLMTFLTSLMRISWTSPDVRMGQLCTDVLRSSSSMLMSIPGLALSNDTRLPQVARNCLNDVMTFLVGVVETDEVADNNCKNYALEILLGLSSLRGNVTFMLNWIDLCLNTSLQKKDGALAEYLYRYWYNSLREEELVSCTFYVL